MYKYFKIIIILFFIIVFIFTFQSRDYDWSIFSIIFILIFIFFYFKNEYLLLSFFCLQKQDMKGLKKWLQYIKNPKLQLTKNQKAYYYLLYGILISQSNILQSEKYMKKALKIGLKFNHNIAIAKLNLSIVALSKGNKRQAEILLFEVKKLDKSGILSQQINIMKENLKKININRKNIQNFHIR